MNLSRPKSKRLRVSRPWQRLLWVALFVCTFMSCYRNFYFDGDQRTLQSSSKKHMSILSLEESRSLFRDPNDDPNRASVGHRGEPSPTRAKNSSLHRMIKNPSAQESNATIVVQLSGEMGNNLQKIAFGRGLQLMARERGVETNLVFRHQETSDKWTLARALIIQCFPNLRQFDFEAGNKAEYRNRVIEQKIKYGSKGEQLKIQNKQDDTISTAMDTLEQLVNPSSHLVSPSPETASDPNTNIRVPFLYADAMAGHDFLDRFRDDFLEFFWFDDEACCAQQPDLDESVFHFRNFKTELSDAADSLGFQELGPQQTAEELFGDLAIGDKVAILSRFKNDDAQSYVRALEARGVQVRLVSGQTPVHDFCFLKNARKEMVGSEISTFFAWAAYLSDAKVRSYFLDANQKVGRMGKYEWQDPSLRKRYRYESYTAL